jgi:hypothetical protein
VPNPVCSQNASVAFNYLIGKGLSSVQAAGVIGNLQAESRLDSRLEAMDTNNKMSRGIAMWQPPRWQNLLTFAAGRDPKALDTQLDFLWYELQSQPGLGLQQLLASTTVEDATVVFQNRFENPLAAKANTPSRISFANSALECLTVRPPDNSPSGGGVVATVGLLALITAVGYGTYKVIEARVPAPRRRPDPEPYYFPRPSPGRVPVSFRRTT